jgi:hypothetical protein
MITFLKERAETAIKRLKRSSSVGIGVPPLCRIRLQAISLAFCPECQSWEFDGRRFDGITTVSCFVVVHYVSIAAFQEDIHMSSQISMDGTSDRVMLISNVIARQWQSVRVGMRVQPSLRGGCRGDDPRQVSPAVNSILTPDTIHGVAS